MFRKSYNRAVLTVRIDTVTPLLIRAGQSGLDPSMADLVAVRTRHGLYGSTVYIPGSSLKGVVRSAAEAAVRGRRFAQSVVGACEDPLNHKEKSCSAAWQNSEEPTPAIHKGHCLACRLFGSMGIKGRASLRDLFPWSKDDSGSLAPGGENHTCANRLELRHGVSIDRIIGSVKQGPFDQELVPAGISFFGDIAFENYQVWQLGLLAQAFDQIRDGIAQLGSSKSRGLGVANIRVTRILHEQAGRTQEPHDVARLATDPERRDYGLLPEGTLPHAKSIARGLAMRFDITDGVDAWLDAGLQALEALQ